MRGNSVLEAGSSLVLAVITGLYGFGGLALGDYAFLASRPSLPVTCLILLVFGLVNLPLFILCSRDTANELASLAATRARRAHVNTMESERVRARGM
jgi:hypothetical protein